MTVDSEGQGEKQTDAMMDDANPDNVSEAAGKPVPELSRQGTVPPPQGVVSSPPGSMPRQSCDCTE